MAEKIKITVATAEDGPMVVSTYRIGKNTKKNAEAAAKQIYKKNLSAAIRQFVEELAKKVKK